MDYEDFCVEAAPAGAWMLEALREAVAAAGVREVHHKLVVLGERGESPPGFTAAVLVDESHVTAHCYSTRGWLAVDVFTCGDSDPRALADAIHARIVRYAPAAVRVQDQLVPRFLHHLPGGAPPQASEEDDQAGEEGAAAAAAAARARVRGVRMCAEGGGGSSGEGRPSEGAADELLAAYKRRLDEEGGANAWRARQDLQAVNEDVQRASKSVRYALDLDGEKAQAYRRGEGDLQSWRLTVGFLGVVLLLSAFTALRTDFGEPEEEVAGPVDNTGVDELIWGRR